MAPFLGLPGTLKYRRTRGDMIEVYKILTDMTTINVNLHLKRQKESITSTTQDVTGLRKYSFTVRIVNLWNSLSENVISANTVDTFKNRLDKFWSEQELVYDNKADKPESETEVWLVWMTLLRYNNKCTYLFVPLYWVYFGCIFIS